MAVMTGKRIWEIIPTLGCGGAEQMVIDLSDGLKKRGYEVTLVVFYDEEYAAPNRLRKAAECGLDICYMGKRPGFDPVLLGKLAGKYRRERPDIIHSHICAFPYAALMRCAFGFTHIHTMHSVAGMESGRIYRALIKYMAERGKTLFVTLNGDTRRTLTERYPVSEKNIACIPNGVDTDRFCPVQREPGESVRVIAVGRLSHVKNHKMLIRAFARAERARSYTDRLTILGEGELRGDLEKEIDALGLEGQVFLEGNVGDVRAYLNVSDIFVMPSRYEGISLALLEAAATGLPVIAAATGGTPETVGNDAVLIGDDDEEELAERLFEMMSCPEIRKRYSESALKIAQRHSLEQMIDGYEALYEKRLKEKQMEITPQG